MSWQSPLDIKKIQVMGRACLLWTGVQVPVSTTAASPAQSSLDFLRESDLAATTELHMEIWGGVAELAEFHDDEDFDRKRANTSLYSLLAKTSNGAIRRGATSSCSSSSFLFMFVFLFAFLFASSSRSCFMAAAPGLPPMSSGHSRNLGLCSSVEFDMS
ncbi:hypothetical protein F5Y17DRAFT_418729 [Xylariaceae sp. FL0594]|nr:hypothetical protein F5Y17DRAFT_418729 [Xylariaceae sp. FL0594]